VTGADPTNREFNAHINGNYDDRRSLTIQNVIGIPRWFVVFVEDPVTLPP
jgi:hypothetical protein